MAAIPEGLISVIDGDVLRRLIAGEVAASRTAACVAFVREHASADAIDEAELSGLLRLFEQPDEP